MSEEYITGLGRVWDIFLPLLTMAATRLVSTSYQAEDLLIRDPQKEGHWRLVR